MNKWWTIGCAVALLIVGFIGGWYINGNRLGKQIAEINQNYADQVAESEKQAKELAAKHQAQMNEQATKYQAAVTESNNDIDKLKAELKNVQKQKPISSDCRIDADRLRLIKQISARANSRGSNS